MTSVIYICWSAQAGLYYHYGIPKYPLPEKLSGIYRHTTMKRDAVLTRGFNDRFYAPHSRYTGVRRQDVEAVPSLTVLADSDNAGVYLVQDEKMHRIFVCGHPEYSRMTLDAEYQRDLRKGIHPAMPHHYYRNDDPEIGPVFQWKAHAYLLFSNWLNYEVYQITPYQLSEIGEDR